MFFCPKCGSLMIARGGALSCPKCGYAKELSQSAIHYFKKSTHFTKVSEKKIDIEGVGVPASAVLDVNMICPRCNNKGVYYWRRHRSSAESSDVIEKMYKCNSCGYSWSEIG